MGTIFFLILFPLLVALVLLIVKADKARDTVVIAASVIIAAVSIYCAATYLGDGTTYFDFSSEIVNYIMMIIECGVAIVITVLAFKYKKYLAAVFALIQTPLMVWFELTTGHSIEVEHNAYVDETFTNNDFNHWNYRYSYMRIRNGLHERLPASPACRLKRQKTLVLLPAVPVPGCNVRSCNFKQLNLDVLLLGDNITMFILPDRLYKDKGSHQKLIQSFNNEPAWRTGFLSCNHYLRLRLG